MPTTLGAVLGGMASVAAVLSYLQSRKRQPARLAPGVTYQATVRFTPEADRNTVVRLIAANGGEVVSITNRRGATYVTVKFTAIAPREVAPGETLFQLEGRKAVLTSIKEL